MEVLKNYYDECKKRLQKILLVFWLVLTLLFMQVNTWLSNCMSQYAIGNRFILELILDFVLDLIVPGTIILLIYSKVMKYIDEEGWKKKYPELDISGTWRDITHYTQNLGGAEMSSVSEANIEVAPARIIQTCREVKIEPSMGDGFTWYSVLCGWNGDNLEILYNVKYNASLRQKGHAESRYGYESMCIDKSKQLSDGRPCKMVGKFRQCCADDGRPVFMGDVVYERDEV